MENKLQVKHYFIAQVLTLYAATILLIMVITAIFGQDSMDYSPMFAFGSKGIPLNTLLQFLLSSVVITILKNFYFSEHLFKKMMTLWRAVLLLFSIFLVEIVFVFIFNWFPVDEPVAWMGFIICFGGGSLGGSLFMIVKTKTDSRRYDELLATYKNQHGGN